MQTQASTQALYVAPAQIPVPPTPPPPPAVAGVGTADARAVLRAKEKQREVVGEQMTRLLRRRDNVLEQLQDPMTNAAERATLGEHLTALNVRIIDMEQQIQRADAEWAAAAAVPGAAVPEPRIIRRDGPPEEMLIIGTIFFGITMVIMAVAIARRILRGGTKVVAQVPAALENRFTRLEQSLDAVAIEVERISEGQRFLTRVFADQNPRGLAGGAPEPVAIPQGEPARQGYRQG